MSEIERKETFYEDHNGGTDTYGRRICYDDGTIETRYDRFSNFENYKSNGNGNYKSSHDHEFVKSNTDSGSKGSSSGGHSK